MFRKLVAATPIVLVLGVAGISQFGFKGTMSSHEHPLVRMPGTQPDENFLIEPAQSCFDCHAGYDEAAEPGFQWHGTMMANAARDPLFWASFAVAAQDSQWAFGTPVAADLCLRCHMPAGWLRGRSDPPNGSAMTADDFDGVSCDICHRMYDPFFEDTFAGTREGSDWEGYWDEQTILSEVMAEETLELDRAQAADLTMFNGERMYGQDNRPIHENYDENASGQYFVAKATSFNELNAVGKRASFADAQALHNADYSRYHKSKFMCATCHDVSNPVLANMDFADATIGDGVTELPSETDPAYSFHAAERTFSEFMASVYGQQGGAPGTGSFAPDVFNTSRPGNFIASCQDCHMPDVSGAGCAFVQPRPDSSTEHPKSGMPKHDMTGGNTWIPRILASTVETSPNYDETNAALLSQGADALTMTFDQGLFLNPAALLDAADRAESMLQRAANIEIVSYDSETGELTFRIRNHTGHKLITGYPEGRRMFATVKLYANGEVIQEINPYDHEAGTLKGLDPALSPNSPSLDAHEARVDEIVYEALSSSSITGEDKSFHFVLATGFQKDNRIPPRGYDIDEAERRQALPASNGAPDPDLFTAEELAGGYNEVTLQTQPGAERVSIALNYQTTSREYIEFLRDEIKGTGNLTLPNEAYIAQTDAFFNQLAAWGDTIWQLWQHNKDLPGAAPVLMTLRSFPGDDPNGDGKVNAVDVQLIINGALGLTIRPFDPDVNGDEAVNAVDVQLAINGALGVK